MVHLGFGSMVGAMVAVAKLERALEIAVFLSGTGSQMAPIPDSLSTMVLMLDLQFVTPLFSVGGSFLPASYGRP